MKNFIKNLNLGFKKDRTGWIIIGSLILSIILLQSCYSDMHFVGTYIPEEDEVIVPLYFTPDGDGVNDYWMVESRGDWDKFTVQVFNKRNQLIWQTEDPRDQGFDGTYVDFVSGDTISTDIYFAFMVWAKEDGNRYFKDGVFINKLNEAETY
jgi:gliding motility-associated-like protein